MRLWAGMSDDFVGDASQNWIADRLRDAFVRHCRFRPSPNEIESWRHSLAAISTVFRNAGFDNSGVILKFQPPLTSKRLDCLVCGSDNGERTEVHLSAESSRSIAGPWRAHRGTTYHATQGDSCCRMPRS